LSFLNVISHFFPVFLLTVTDIVSNRSQDTEAKSVSQCAAQKQDDMMIASDTQEYSSLFLKVVAQSFLSTQMMMMMTIQDVQLLM
jgi:hypothetical protein